MNQYKYCNPSARVPREQSPIMFSTDYFEALLGRHSSASLCRDVTRIDEPEGQAIGK